MTTLTAATEVLLRWHDGAFAAAGRPWMRREPDGGVWLDLESIPGRVGVLSGGERRILLAATSLATGHPVDLSDVVSGMDRDGVDLLLAACAHAGGATALHPWPAVA